MIGGALLVIVGIVLYSIEDGRQSKEKLMHGSRDEG